MKYHWALICLLTALLIMPSLACKATPKPPATLAPTATSRPTQTPLPTYTPASTQTPLPTSTPVPTPTPAEYPLSEIVDRLSPSVVLIMAEFPGDEWASGTGVIYDGSGLAVTNAHVVAGASIIKASVPGRKSWISAKIVGLSPCDDLAVIDLEGSGFTRATLGESDTLKVGQEVVAIGYPLAGDLDTQLTVNRGIVSKMHTPLDQLTDLIQTDTPINPGNSGGPLVNRRGEVVGINTIKVEYTSDGRPVQGINFAIGISLAKEVIAELERGENRHWLGLNMITNDWEVADYFDLPTAEGMLVYAVADGSPAAEARLEVGDILLQLKGIAVQSEEDVCNVLRSHHAGDPLPVEVVRGGQTLRGAIGGAPLVAPALPPTPPPGEEIPSLTYYHNEGLGVAFPYPQGWFISEEDDAVVFESPQGNVSLFFGLYDVEMGTTAQEVMEQTIAYMREDHPDLKVLATDFLILTERLEAAVSGVVFTDEEEDSTKWAFIIEMVQEATNYTMVMLGDESADSEMWGSVLAEILEDFEVLPDLGISGDEEEVTLLFTDDFSDPESGWATYDDAEATAQYDDGAFRISVSKGQYIAWSRRPQEFDDFALEVSTLWLRGNPANAYGILFRFQDSENFYQFDVDGEGYFMAGKYVDDEWIFLVDWQESEALNHGANARNDLAVVCQENELGFYANGELLATVMDDTFARGEVGLLAETFDEGGVEILFDDLYIWPVP